MEKVIGWLVFIMRSVSVIDADGEHALQVVLGERLERDEGLGVVDVVQRACRC
ncbi:MAG: hypothetical protein R2854_28285 [Caldilineaceae bacterium]